MAPIRPNRSPDPRSLARIAILLGCMAAALPARGATVIWLGGSTGSTAGRRLWSNGAHWSPSGLPPTWSDVLFDNGAPGFPQSTSTDDVADLKLNSITIAQSSLTLNIAAPLTVTTTAGGGIPYSGGTIARNAINGRLQVQTGGALTFHNTRSVELVLPTPDMATYWIAAGGCLALAGLARRRKRRQYGGCVPKT